MKTEIPTFSGGFEQLYCDAAVFDPFSALHPISFRRVLPFQAGDPVVDDQCLLGAEQAHFTERNDDRVRCRKVTRRRSGGFEQRLVPQVIPTAS